MTYLESFTLPSGWKENLLPHAFNHPKPREGDFNAYTNEYPFGIFPNKQLGRIDFSEITIFYGGNGSGKTTLLNLIAQALRLPRITPFNTSVRFEGYVKNYCVLESRGIIPRGSAIFTSDDIFHKIIDRRVENEKITEEQTQIGQDHANELMKDQMGELAFHTLDDYDALVKRIEARHSTRAKYIRNHARELMTPDSNGEYALKFYREHLQDDCLYLLDEPENSLSIKYQLKLSEMLIEYSRFFGCQFIISSHSPVFLSMKNAKIYDLDSIPVSVKDWWELENMQLYYALFKIYREKFEK